MPESKVQAMAAKLAYLAKKGKFPVSKLKKSALQMYNTMSEEELKDFAFPSKKKFKSLPRRK